jgi:hypothetical protein
MRGQPLCTILPDTTPDSVNPSPAAEILQVIALGADPFRASSGLDLGTHRLRARYYPAIRTQEVRDPTVARTAIAMSRRRPSPGPLSSRLIRPILAAARREAEAARHGYVGLEHLLISLTQPEASETARLLVEHGITTQRARDAVWLVVGSGRGDGPRFDPATLLATLGIDLDQIRRHVEAQFGPNAIHNLYAGPVGWNLRPRGPLCELGLSPELKGAVDGALGRCWDTAPPQLHERLLFQTLDSDSAGVSAVLHELAVPVGPLRAAVGARLRIAS